VAGRRAGRLAVAAGERRTAATDAGSAVSAAAAVLAQQIIDLDGRPSRGKGFDKQYRRLVSDYAELLGEFPGREDPAALERRIEALSTRCRKLAARAG
jgi:hypothetical protein